MRDPPVCLHYCTGTADYFIIEYDGEDAMYGRVSLSVYPYENSYRKLSLSELKSNPLMKLDFSWQW